MRLVSIVEEPGFAARRELSTLKNYHRAIARLAASGIVDVEHVTVDALRGYVDVRLGQVQPQSAAVEVQALLALLNHLTRTRRFDVEELVQLRQLRPVSRKPEMLCAAWLTPLQVEDLCVIAGIGTLTDWTIRWGALTGLRSGELCRLRWDDVHLDAREICVRGPVKTRRERKVPIVAPLLSVIGSHPIARLTRLCGEGLVISRQATIHPRCLGYRLAEAERKADGFHATMNLLRHTRASWWLQSGTPLVKVAKWMGHSPEVCARFYGGLLSGYDPDADRVA